MFVEYQNEDRITLRSPSHSVDTLRLLSSFRQLDVLCDVVFLVEGHAFPAHRALLASCSDYFKVMFTGSMIEANKREITLESITQEAMQQILDFVYDGRFSIDMQSVVDIVHAASMLLMSDVKTECFKYLMNNLSVLNCVRMKSIAEAYGHQEMLSKSVAFITKNFEVLTEKKEVASLELTDLKSFLGNDTIKCRSEDTVCKAVAVWVKSRRDVDATELRALLKTIRLPYVSHGCQIELYQTLRELDKDLNSEDFSTVLYREQKLQNRTTRRKSLQPRLCQQVSSIIFCVSQRGETFCYNMTSKTLHRLAQYPHFRMPGELTVHNNIVYATAGELSYSMRSKVSNAVHSFDPVTCSWKELPSMSYGRDKHSAVFLRDKLYIIGGRNGDMHIENLSRSVECFDLATSTWSFKTSTLDPRTSSAVAASGKNIYVMGGEGGTGGIRGLNSVERYCPVQDTWIAMPSMHHQRISSSAVFFNEKIFVFGGSNGVFELNSFEFIGLNDRSWTVVSIPYVTPICTALAMDDKILALGSSSWGDDLVLQYSFVRRRGVHWKHIRDFIHASHRTRSLKYSVIRMMNYDVDSKPEAHCECTYYEDSETVRDDDDDDEDDDEAMSSSRLSSDSDGEGWMDFDPIWGIWV